MRPQKFILSNQQARDNACDAIKAAEDGQIVSIGATSRTTQQNATIHMWFSEIARHKGDRTTLNVKGECHHKYGLPIRLADPVFAFVWKRSADGLTYEQQCTFLASECISVSSAMGPKELGGYMDQMMADYREEGVFLTDPYLKGCQQ